MAVPSHNPDGMEMVVDNYNRYKGTQYEGASTQGTFKLRALLPLIASSGGNDLSAELRLAWR